VNMYPVIDPVLIVVFVLLPILLLCYEQRKINKSK